MRMYRFCRKRQANDLPGTGAKLVGGRWNSPGVPVLYTSENRALALAEYWVHVHPSNLPTDVCVVEIEVPDTTRIISIPLSSLPENRRAGPPLRSLRQTGDQWVLKGKSLILKISSTVMPLESNYILNPAHQDMTAVSVSSITNYV
ncbi:MAG: RES family NAD+ phosphorylase [bacterium]|nr:RES family NAD+ phosphorylase [bacterium]